VFSSKSFSTSSFGGKAWTFDYVTETLLKKKELVSVSGEVNIPLLMNQRVLKEIKVPSFREQILREDEEIVVLIQSLFLEGVL
jgi:hypothetical protein